MNHIYRDEHQIVDRYLMGRLPPEEAAEFEQHYLHCRDCLDRLEVGEKLVRGFKRAAAADAAKVEAVARLGVLAWLARRARSPRTALALAAVLAAILLPAGLLYRQLGEARSSLARAFEPQINTAVLSFNPERGGPAGASEPTHVLRLSGTPEWLVLSLELDETGFDSYRVTLLRDGGDEVWRGDGVEPGPFDALVLSLHSTWLDAGDYAVRVEGLPAAADPVPVARFSFRVLAPGS